MNTQLQNQIRITQPVSFRHTRLLQRKCACGQHTIAGGECAGCRQKREEMMQRAAVSATPVNSVPPIVHDVLGSPGQPLDARTRAFMEPRFGHDFSGVRVHTDDRAAESARSVNALAYTMGRDVVFGTGQYAPGASEGRRLLAHELTHVVQQGSNPTLHGQSISSPGDSSEQEAALTAEAILTEKSLPTLSTSSSLVQRQDAGVAPPPSGSATPLVAAPPAAGGGAIPAPSLAGLTATRVAFNTTGAPDPDNCAPVKPTSLGVQGNGRNNMELIFHINGAIPAGTEFDITRTRAHAAWESDATGTWSLLERDPAGTNDDHHDDDECLRPKARRIFVVDTPGFIGLNPRGRRLIGGSTVSATATAFARRFNFAEWVIARNRPLGIGWTRISAPTFTHWHSITSLALVGGTWQLVDTPSGQKNEIKLGSISTAGATP